MKNKRLSDAASGKQLDALSPGLQPSAPSATGRSLVSVVDAVERIAGILSGAFETAPAVAPYQSIVQELADKMQAAPLGALLSANPLSPYVRDRHAEEYGGAGHPLARHSIVAESVHKALMPDDQIRRDLDVLSALLSDMEIPAVSGRLEQTSVSARVSEPQFNLVLHGLEGVDSSDFPVDHGGRSAALPDWPANLRKQPYAL